jgi:GTP-binding protein
VDKCRIRVRAGIGGDGCNAMEGDSAIRRWPSGGHGGKGGDVYIVAQRDMQSLSFPTHHFNAKHGTNGMGSSKHGRGGVDRIIRVPCGTIVKAVSRPFDDFGMQIVPRGGGGGGEEDVDGGGAGGAGGGPPRPPAAGGGGGGDGDGWADDDDDAAEEEVLTVLADLDLDGAEMLLASGGEGGVGNCTMKGAGGGGVRGQLVRDQPAYKRKGKEGEELFIELELKTIANVGLVGYPNAGKSTFLSAVSRAAPRVAPYPFTTLHPFVGHVYFADDVTVTVADIPGLIEGAHENVGLGHAFLRHIERTQVLLYVLDGAGTEGRSPVDDLRALRHELAMYDAALLEKPGLVLANKMDELEEAEGARLLADLRASTDMAVLTGSALYEPEELDRVLQGLRLMVGMQQQAAEAEAAEAAEAQEAARAKLAAQQELVRERRQHRDEARAQGRK